MAKGMRVKLNYDVSRDPDTGAEITRLTPPEVTCHRNYFYQKCFFNDGSHLLFAGEFDGNWNYYLLDLAKAEAVQLTEGAGDNTFGGFLSPDDKSLYYVKNDRTLLEVNLTTLQEREVYRVADDWVGYGTWVANSDCTKLVGIEIAKSDWTPLNDWQIFHDFFHKGPHCRLLRVDLQTGESSVIHEEKKWLGHPIYRPFDDHTVAFCHEGPHDLVDARMWMVNEDGSNVRKVKAHAEGESCTHEFWVPNGSALVYVSYLKGQQGRTIYSFNPDTGVNEAVMQMPACSHLMSNFDGTMLVGDGSGTPVTSKTPAATPLITTRICTLSMSRSRPISALRVTIPPGQPWPIVARLPTRTRPLRRTIAPFCSAPIKTANLPCISRSCRPSLRC